MNQEFKGPVFGDVAGRDVVTQINHDAGRVLTSQERIELNDRVKQLTEGYGEPGWKTWRFLHRTIGIENIEAMRLGHRDFAHAILDLLLERSTLQKNCSQQQNHDEDNAGQLATLLMQNSKLTAQLRESQSVRTVLERRQGGEDNREKEILSQLEMFKFDSGKNEKLIAHAVNQCRQLDGALQHANKRGNRFLALFLLCGLASLAGIAMIYYLTARIHVLEERLTNCAFEGKAYALGSVIDGTPDRECVRNNDGRTAWKAVSEKTRRQKG